MIPFLGQQTEILVLSCIKTIQIFAKNQSQNLLDRWIIKINIANKFAFHGPKSNQHKSVFSHLVFSLVFGP